MQGKTVLMAGVAAVALVASSDAGLAKTKHHAAHHRLLPIRRRRRAGQNGPSNAGTRRRGSRRSRTSSPPIDSAHADHTRLSTLEQNFNDTTWTFDNAVRR